MSGVLASKRAIVTGGTHGIGRAIAEAFTREGACVSVCARIFGRSRTSPSRPSA
jgi:NAD(P)-dependent dehydrogenase (short-subunit alcohol dehydrogenase family)